MAESYHQWAQRIESRNFTAVQAGGVVHAPGERVGSADSYTIAKCVGCFSIGQTELLQEDAVITCLWCVAGRNGNTVEWFIRG